MSKPDGGWDIRVQGEMVDLDEIIEALTELKRVLNEQKVPDGTAGL